MHAAAKEKAAANAAKAANEAAAHESCGVQSALRKITKINIKILKYKYNYSKK